MYAFKKKKIIKIYMSCQEYLKLRKHKKIYIIIIENNKNTHDLKYIL